MLNQRESYNLEKTENIDNDVWKEGNGMSEHEVLSVIKKINMVIWSVLIVNVLLVGRLFPLLYEVIWIAALIFMALTSGVALYNKFSVTNLLFQGGIFTLVLVLVLLV